MNNNFDEKAPKPDLNEDLDDLYRELDRIIQRAEEENKILRKVLKEVTKGDIPIQPGHDQED